MYSGHEMIKHDYNEEKMISMRLKLPKLGFLLDLLKLEPSSRRDLDEEPKQCHGMQVPTSRCGTSEPRKLRDVRVFTSRRGVFTL